MYDTVYAFLEKNKEVFSDIAEFTSHSALFKAKIVEIGAKEDERNKATTGKTRNKVVTRNVVTTRALAVAGAVYALAKKKKNVTLTESTNYRRFKLDHLRDVDLKIELNSIKEKAEANASELEPYGFPEEKLTEFANYIESYSQALGTKETGGTLKKGAGKTLASLFKEADSLLDNMDRFVENYHDTNVQFYTEYKANRRIKNLGIRHLPGEQAPPANQTAVSISPPKESIVPKSKEQNIIRLLRKYKPAGKFHLQ